MPETDSPTLSIRKRDGRIANFNPKRISDAIAAAMRAEQEIDKSAPLSEQTIEIIEQITGNVVSDASFEARQNQDIIDVERVQDLVETHLMEAGEFSVARRYIIYREQRSRARAIHGEQHASVSKLSIVLEDGRKQPIDGHSLKRRLYEVCHGLKECSATDLLSDVTSSLYDGISEAEFEKVLVMVARQRIEREPSYNKVATRLMLNIIYRQALGKTANFSDIDMPLFDSENKTESTFEQQYKDGFKQMLKVGTTEGRVNPELLNFDIEKICAALEPQRDQDFQYLGIQTLYDRYLLHIKERRIETPQYLWMRVAMGLSINEENKEERAIEFYNVLSTRRFVSATPTLFNAGTTHPQLSSCYLSTVDDDLYHIFKCIQDDAMLSKWAGGLGNDWTRVRATGAHIKGTNGKSQGIIPFLKVANDTALAVNQGGKRKGAACAYIEPWHLDIEDFLDLRKNTGDERRRTHDMHTAVWVPDLFVQRVIEEGKWTLFSPHEVPELHETYGLEFKKIYQQYEAKAKEGQLEQYKEMDAVTLWRRILSMLFETGHPWMTFKDPSNLRSPQDHVGTVHNSNLCTEILLNTSNDETAVCNLGSINLKKHTDKNGIRKELLEDTIKTAMRMLDNVIDINYYPTKEAKNANMHHRPVGLGVMGFQDALYEQRIAYGSNEAIEFADSISEIISYNAILSSSLLAKERGAYESYKGSKWDRGILPIDSIELVKQSRDGNLDMDNSSKLDWTLVRESISKYAMRNSNTMAIAPTATISNIAGCTQSIEPTYKNIFVKSNLSGDFTIINEYLVNDLKSLDLWDDKMIDDIKYNDGELEDIDRIPQDLKELYKTTFEVDPYYLIECTSRRQKWVDMGISFNLYLGKPSGKALDDMYKLCWQKGLKTTYYLRSKAATQIEKSSVDINKHGMQPRWMKNKSDSAALDNKQETPEAQEISARGDLELTEVKACLLNDPECEACQ